MARAHRAEVTMIERGELRLTQPLCDREDCAIDKTDFQISVGTQELVRAFVVGGRQISTTNAPRRT